MAVYGFKTVTGEFIRSAKQQTGFADGLNKKVEKDFLNFYKGKLKKCLVKYSQGVCFIWLPKCL